MMIQTNSRVQKYFVQAHIHMHEYTYVYDFPFYCFVYSLHNGNFQLCAGLPGFIIACLGIEKLRKLKTKLKSLIKNCSCSNNKTMRIITH